MCIKDCFGDNAGRRDFLWRKRVFLYENVIDFEGIFFKIDLDILLR